MKSRRYLTTAFALVASACILAATAAPAAAQSTGKVQGQVVEAMSQRPLAGAQVFIPGTGVGALTNSDGRYILLNVPAGDATVRVQMIGYGTAEETVTVRAGQTTTVNFELGQSAIALDEVVVTGQGRAVEHRQLGTTVDVISTQEIDAAPVTSVDQLLQGRVSGAQVSAVSAQPGTASQINFRGVTSVIGSQTPVIYIDGVRVDNSDNTSAWTGGEYSSALSELLTSDIERIEVTKGGAASTLYGSDAAAGVIQIFTKKGTPGAPRVTARIEQGVDVPEMKYVLDSQHIFKDMVEAGEAPANFMRDNFFQTGYFQNYSVRVAGGESAFTYNVSGRIQQGDGVQPKNDHAIYALRGAIQAEVSDRLRLDFNGSYTRSNFNRLYNGTAIQDPLTTFEVGDALYFSGESTLEDALDVFLMPDITESVNRFIFGTSANYQTTDVFSQRLALGVDYRGNHQRILEPIGFTPGEPTGFLLRYNREFTSVTLDYAGTISYPQSGPVTSDFTFGAQGFREDESIISAEGIGFIPGAADFDEAGEVTAFENNTEIFNGGLFLQERLGLGERLFVTAGLRLDYNSAFGENVGFETYPKLETSYLLSDEPFMEDLFGSVFSEFKLRAAYGKAGKFPEPYLRDRTFNAVSFRGSGAPRFDNPGNTELGPEVTTTFEAGFDAAFLDDRVGLSLTYFDAVTSDALFFVPEQPSTGWGSQLRNVGEIKNTGFEIDANVQVINTRDLAWSVNATLNTVDNEVVSLGGAAPFFVDAQQRVDEGKPVGAWYVTTPIDTNGDGKPDASERRYTGGQPTPTMNGSFSTRFTLFNRLTLSAMADWAAGHQVMDYGSVWATYNSIYRREILEEGYSFPVIHDENGDPVLDENGDPVHFSQTNARSEFIYDGDYMKLREIAARYAVPSAWAERFGAARASLYGSVRNVAVWSRNPLIDPELSGVRADGELNLGGASSITLSPPRQFRLGLEVTF